MKVLSAVALAIVLLFTGTTANSSATETVAPSNFEVPVAAWESFDSAGIVLPDTGTELIVTYRYSVDGNHEYTTGYAEFPVWDMEDPTVVHIFKVEELHYA